MNGWNGSKGYTKAPLKTPKHHLVGWVVSISTITILIAMSIYFSPSIKTSVHDNCIPKKTLRNSKSNRKVSVQTKQSSEKMPQRILDAVAIVETNQALRIASVTQTLKNPFTNRVFQSGVEQKLSLLFTTEVGDLPPPMPPLVDEDRQNLAAILISKNEITEADDDLTSQCKDIVDCAKVEMRKFIKDGGDPDDFLNYYHEELLAAHHMREEALRQLEQIEDEAPDLSRDFIVKVNEVFSKRGIKLLEVPDDLENP